jgi:acetylglutamate kinase
VIAVVKVGGAAVGAASVVAAMRSRGRELAVVHGAGPQISARCREAGITPRFVDGQRVTDTAVLALVREGLEQVGSGLVAALTAAGVPAQAVHDALAGEPSADGRLGFVGRVSAVDSARLRRVLRAGGVPVVSPLAGGLNVNADHAAAAVAGALGASELLFLSDVCGVLDRRGRVIRRIRIDDADALIAGGQVTGGMIPKLQAGAAALAGGVWRVWIGAETMVTA